MKRIRRLSEVSTKKEKSISRKSISQSSSLKSASKSSRSSAASRSVSKSSKSRKRKEVSWNKEPTKKKAINHRVRQVRGVRRVTIVKPLESECSDNESEYIERQQQRNIGRLSMETIMKWNFLVNTG